MTNLLIRAAIYARISELDPEVEATADQERRCRELAAREGYEVVAVFIDGISAFSGKYRPGWAELAHAVQSGSIDMILAVAEDRLARNSVEKSGFTAACARAGVRWHTVGGGLLDPKTAGGALMATITGGIAEYESAIKSERVSASVVRRLLEGRDMGGPRPFGYTANRRELIESEANLVREGHRMLLAGFRMYAVTKMFIDSGVPPVKTKRWAYISVAAIMRRPRNASLAIRDGEVYELTQHPPIVSREDHEAVAALLYVRPSGGRAPKHLASGGVARCGTCGGPLRYSSQKKGMYRCANANGGLGPVDGLTHASVKTTDLDARIITEVVPALMKRLGQGTDEDTVAGAKVRVLIAERAELYRQRDAAQEMYLMPGVDKTKLRMQIANIAERVEMLDEGIMGARVDSLTGVQAIARALNDADPIEFAGAQFTERWNVMALEEQRQLVKVLMEVKIHPVSICRQMAIVVDEKTGEAEVVVTREGPERIAVRYL